MYLTNTWLISNHEMDYNAGNVILESYDSEEKALYRSSYFDKVLKSCNGKQNNFVPRDSYGQAQISEHYLYIDQLT